MADIIIKEPLTLNDWEDILTIFFETLGKKTRIKSTKVFTFLVFVIFLLSSIFLGNFFGFGAFFVTLGLAGLAVSHYYYNFNVIIFKQLKKNGNRHDLFATKAITINHAGITIANVGERFFFDWTEIEGIVISQDYLIFAFNGNQLNAGKLSAPPQEKRQELTAILATYSKIEITFV